MASVAAVCDSYKQEVLQGIHLSSDTYFVALYTSSATLSKSTTAYTATGEVSGTGYVAGGQALSGFTTGLSTDTAYLNFANSSWASSSITAVTALIYNSSKSNKAVCVLTFSSTTSTNGTWTLQFPANGASSTVTIA